MSDLDELEQDRAPTIARRRGARSERPAAESQVRSTAPRPGSGFASAEDTRTVAEAAIDGALQVEEATRMRGFSRIAMLMIALVAAQMPFLGGAPFARALVLVALAAMFGFAVYGYVQSRAGRLATHRVFRVQAWGLGTCILAVEHYFGFHSPITVVLSLGIYHMAQSGDRLHALLVPLFVTAGWTVGAALTSLGVIADVGLYRIEGVAPGSQLLMITGVTCTLLGATWLAQVARRSVREAAFESNRALLVAQKRDALLQEAQHQLDHAMRVSVGKPGRHTGELAGQYRLDELIGLGAMGEVYAAHHEPSGREVAVKLLQASTLRRDDHVARFMREAELCTRFSHPNVVKVFDVGQLANGSPFMAMERLHGETLSDMLRERGQLSIAEVLELGDAAGAGLTHAHDHGIIHRDFKPHNLLAARGAEGTPLRWTVLDFGISKPFDSTGTLTGVDGVVGTPSYMSPEQARNLPLDTRSDLFSFASVLYRALTGHPAFLGKDAPGIMFDVVYRMPERPSRQNESLPHDVDLALAIALAKDPQDRFETAHELMAALRSASQGALSDVLRARAKALLARTSWGTRLT